MNPISSPESWAPVDGGNDRPPLVSITIPTKNSGEFLEQCLASVRDQTHSAKEIIVMDGGSRDNTIDIARRYDARVVGGGPLAERRLLGVNMSHGDFVLMLDSDQVLEPDALSKCIRLCQEGGYDALVLRESPLVVKTFVQRAIAFDKILTHSKMDYHPIYGTLLPRFFRGDFIRKLKWPTVVNANDHALINYVCWRSGSRTALAPAKIFHHDPDKLGDYSARFYRWGFYYVREIFSNPAVTVTHALPRRVYLSRIAIKNPMIFGVALLYGVKMVSAALGAAAAMAESVAKTAEGWSG